MPFGNARQKHRGRRREAAAGDLSSGGGDAGGQGPFEHGAGEARVAADGDPREQSFVATFFFPSFTPFLPEELNEPLADEEGHGGGNSQGLALDPRDGDAADVGAVLEALVDELVRGRRSSGRGVRRSGGGGGDGGAAGGSCFFGSVLFPSSREPVSY